MTMRLFFSALVACISACSVCAEPSSNTSTRDLAPETLRAWVDARAGTGAPVHWVAVGGVYGYPSGEKRFGMIGFDSSTVIWPASLEEQVVHLTRKTFTYTDPVSGEVLTEFNGHAVTPIAYPYQVIRYRIEDDKIFGDVEQGVGERIQQIKARNGMRVRMLGVDTMAVTGSVFLDFPLPDGQRYEAWENYDFFIHTSDGISEPHQMSWQRYGSLPTWAGDGRAIYHLLSWRVESQAEFPSDLLAWAKAEMPAWLHPPVDLEEVRALQQGASLEAWPR